MLISVHIPKTAGTSLGLALEQHFGAHLLHDYQDRPLSDALKQRFYRQYSRWQTRTQADKLMQQYDAVHGHFVADKYQLSALQPQFCAFFRDPLARVASHYFHWQRSPDMANAMCRQMIEQKLDLAAFSRLPKQQRFYRLFVGRVPIEQFAFIGLTEAYSESILLFNRIFHLQLPVLAENIGDQTDYPQQLKELGCYDAVREAQRDNQQLYDAVRRQFDVLCAKHYVFSE